MNAHRLGMGVIEQPNPITLTGLKRMIEGAFRKERTDIHDLKIGGVPDKMIGQKKEPDLCRLSLIPVPTALTQRGFRIGT